MSTPQSPTTGQSFPARVQIAKDRYYVGYVKDGTFYVEDDVDNGVSHQALTHTHPHIKPKSLADIEARGQKVEYTK